MKICLVGYLDNTVENKLMLDTYELRNDFWAENFKFRRKDLKPITDEELKWVSAWIDREIIKKHRTNWLGEKNPAYIDVTDPAVIKRYYSWMTDEEIHERLEAERRQEFFKKLQENLPYKEWKRMMMAMPWKACLPAPKNVAKQLEIEFKD